jgi:hydrogenase maturation protease
MDVRVIGLGNVLMGDDGLGPYVVKTLEARYAFPPDVTLVDAGTPGLDLVPFLVDADVVILIDTVKSSECPGTVRTYDKGVLMKHAPQPRLSPHDPGVKQTLMMLDFAGHAPREVLLVGVVPQWVATCPHLSEPVKAAVPLAIERVLYELKRLGLRPWPNPEPHAPDIWWENEPAHA